MSINSRSVANNMKVGILLCVMLMTFIDFSNAVKCYKCEGDTRDTSNNGNSYNNCKNPGRSLKDGKLSVDETNCGAGCKSSDWNEVTKDGENFTLFVRGCMPSGEGDGCAKVTRNDTNTGSISVEYRCLCQEEFCNGGILPVVNCYQCSGDTRKTQAAYNNCKNPAKQERGNLSLPVMQCFEGCRSASENVKKGGDEFSLFSRGCLTKGEKIGCETIERNDTKRGELSEEICNCERDLCNDKAMASGDSQRLSFSALSIIGVILISVLNRF